MAEDAGWGEAWLDYAVRWRAGGVRPGRHPARQAGRGGGFRGTLPFWQLPDASRIDVRRSLLDPAGGLVVRQTEQAASIDVILAVDLSASMFVGSGGAADVAGLAAAAARSALRAGDGFGVVGFDSLLVDAMWLPPTRSRGAARQMVARLGAYGVRARGTGAAGLLALAGRLPARRCLVLLVSDFLMPPGLLADGLDALARHDVAPIVLGGEDVACLPAAGLLRLADAEGGGTRLVLMRPALRRRMLAAAADRRAALDRLFLGFGRPAFHAKGRLDLDALSTHLQQG